MGINPQHRLEQLLHKCAPPGTHLLHGNPAPVDLVSPPARGRRPPDNGYRQAATTPKTYRYLASQPPLFFQYTEKKEEADPLDPALAPEIEPPFHSWTNFTTEVSSHSHDLKTTALARIGPYEKVAVGVKVNEC
ncbi:MAG: hypothetical protein ACK5DV_14585 [Planctomycetota bacterium]|nr:hypothetical protein [Planctomycetota bacterium]